MIRRLEESWSEETGGWYDQKRLGAGMTRRGGWYDQKRGVVWPPCSILIPLLVDYEVSCPDTHTQVKSESGFLSEFFLLFVNGHFWTWKQIMKWVTVTICMWRLYTNQLWHVCAIGPTPCDKKTRSEHQILFEYCVVLTRLDSFSLLHYITETDTSANWAVKASTRCCWEWPCF